jgi:hypothetical protein
VDPIKAITLTAKEEITVFVLGHSADKIRKFRKYVFGRPATIGVTN